MYIIITLVYYVSKKQSSMENNSFNSCLAYKLQLENLPYKDKAYVKANDQSVQANITIPDSTLNMPKCCELYGNVWQEINR